MVAKIKVLLIVIIIQFELHSYIAQFPTSVSHSSASITMYKELLRDLFDDYDIRIRPRLNQSSTVEVNTSFTLNSVVDFDTAGQSIVIMGFFIITWFDEVLKWDPNDYGKTNYFRVRLNDIWYPQIEFSKTNDASKTLGDKETEIAKISYNGFVVWTHDGIFNSMCKVTVKYYPFDVQTCELIYHAAGENKDTVLLNVPHANHYFNLLENSEWRVVKTTAKVIDSFNTNVMFIVVTVQRRAEFTLYTMIIPLATLAVVNVFTFLVPIESGEKGSLSITLFLAYGFFATITRDSLPHNSIQVSYYIVYVTTLLIFSVFTVIYVIIEAKINSSIGSNEINICKIKSNQVKSVDAMSKTNDEYELENMPQMDKTLTWNEFLKKMDIVMFLFRIFAMSIYSTVLWTYVYKKSKI